MYEFLLLLLGFGAADVPSAPKHDYVGLVAAEASYSALLPRRPDTKPGAPLKGCTICNGTNKVRSGGGETWVKCPANHPDADPAPAQGTVGAAMKAATPAPGIKIPKSDPARYNKPLPSVPAH